LKCQKILGCEKITKHIKSIVEFGCAELKLFVYLKNGVKSATKIDFVDIDGELLERCKNRIEPLICEHLKKRELPLLVNIWKGSVAEPNPNFEKTDAVVAIELYEASLKFFNSFTNFHSISGLNMSFLMFSKRFRSISLD
jgi:hypothetical protein